MLETRHLAIKYATLHCFHSAKSLLDSSTDVSEDCISGSVFRFAFLGRYLTSASASATNPIVIGLSGTDQRKTGLLYIPVQISDMWTDYKSIMQMFTGRYICKCVCRYVELALRHCWNAKLLVAEGIMSHRN